MVHIWVGEEKAKGNGSRLGNCDFFLMSIFRPNVSREHIVGPGFLCEIPVKAFQECNDYVGSNLK